MEKTLNKYYDESFYSKQIKGSVSSAEIILNILYKYYKPNSVIDFGCGRGSWLAVAESLGSNKLKGLEGDWVKKEELLTQNIDLTNVDFEEGFDITKKYDLCICCEVAEHISEKQANSFIDNLCHASDIIIFSAAIPYQGGANHVNEQWQSYWIKLFQSKGYQCIDLFRTTIWDNKAVEWWYRENILLFVKKTSNIEIVENIMADSIPLDLVHPQHFIGKLKRRNNRIQELKNQIEFPTLRFCLGSFKRYFLTKLGNKKP